MKNSEVNELMSMLKTTSSLTALEMPALLVAVLALIPGGLDEAAVAVGGVVVYAALAIYRRHIIKNRNKYKMILDKALLSNEISHKQYEESLCALNKLTVAGGK